MDVAFFLTAFVAILATMLALTRAEPVHGLLYLVVSLLASSLVLWMLGAPFAAALEVIVYAGAIVVLFVFVVMLVGHRPSTVEEERRWIRPSVWIGPSLLAGVLLVELALLLGGGGVRRAIGPTEVGAALYGPYLIAVEAASFLLLAGVIGAWQIGRPE